MKAALFASTLFLATFGVSAQAPSADQFNRAVMQAYDEMLRENFKDYETLFRRSNALYNRGEYLNALQDLDSAVKYAPASDTDTRFAIYALRAECYRALKRYTQALPEANEALKLDPTSVAMLRLRGDILYDLGQLGDAKSDYNRMLRIQPRSAEAFFGLAMVAAKEQNVGLANDYVNRILEVAQNKSNAYVRAAQVKELTGDYTGAVNDLLKAVAANASDPDALPQLIKLANSNYSAVNSGLSAAIDANPRQPLFYFLRGSIAAAHYHYGAAISDFNYIIDENLYAMNSLNADLARCYYALGHYDTALQRIEAAIAGISGDDDDPCAYYTVRARILRALGRFNEAKVAADRALDFGPDNAEAMVEKALVLTSLKEAQNASTLLGEVVMSNPYEPMNYMLRAWVLNDFLNQQKAAKGLYGRVIDLELDHSERIGSLLGFAELFDGKTAKGIAWMDALLAGPDYDGMLHYYGACFYAWAGKQDRALDCMEQALKAGYANYHEWTADNDGRINVAPIRDSARFKELLEQYKSIFAL